ncbi:hypothetical protein [Thaumasiovibrio subtropicus]|uniref:hypothetical protein n=1 Tax=Thaumasiovibrio subtropicus TaxID=1891207 RepID=UPI00131D44FA|nr:hypothetical protein [Thaumasiovibrio subtropicus]
MDIVIREDTLYLNGFATETVLVTPRLSSQYVLIHYAAGQFEERIRLNQSMVNRADWDALLKLAKMAHCGDRADG